MSPQAVTFLRERAAFEVAQRLGQTHAEAARRAAELERLGNLVPKDEQPLCYPHRGRVTV